MTLLTFVVLATRMIRSAVLTGYSAFLFHARHSDLNPASTRALGVVREVDEGKAGVWVDGLTVSSLGDGYRRGLMGG